MARGLKTGAAVVALVIATGCGLVRGNDDEVAAPAPASTEESLAPSEEPEPIAEESPTPTPEPTKPAKKPTKKATTRAAEPTQPAFWSELPDCAHYDKT